jgi:hypothetical protein
MCFACQEHWWLSSPWDHVSHIFNTKPMTELELLGKFKKFERSTNCEATFQELKK